MIQLSYRETKPIFEQIKEGLRRLIVSGAVQVDEKLPSVRELASSLAINPNTILRAYRELETEGYVYTVAGKGTFVSSGEMISEGREEELWQSFDETVTELCYMSVSPEQLNDRIKILKEGGKISDTGKSCD